MTGIALTETYSWRCVDWAFVRAPITATAFGHATALPLFVMVSSMGYGYCGRHSGDARRLGFIMLLGHAAFGAGIGVWTAYHTQGMKRRGTCSRYCA